MQKLFPEGACFTNTLYGLAWTNLSNQFPEDSDLRLQAIKEASWIIGQYDEPYVSQYFQNTQVPNGVFWLGQKNLLLGQLLEITPVKNRPQQYIDQFHQQSAALFKAFLESSTIHLDSYPGLCWPADNVTALMSLLLHDQLYPTDYKKAYAAWKKWTQDHFDPNTGMPAGHLSSTSGELLQPARGCANSWILSLLPKMDPAFAKQQYRKYQSHFLIRHFGFRMFREYPASMDLPADVDSGPIIWGAGITATGVGLGTCIANGDIKSTIDIHHLANMFGWPNHFNVAGGEGRNYLFGLLPIGDAFLTWAYSLENNSPQMSTAPSFWDLVQQRMAFYLISTFLICLFLIRGFFHFRSIRLKLNAIND
jgi:hypothetical protein